MFIRSLVNTEARPLTWLVKLNLVGDIRNVRSLHGSQSIVSCTSFAYPVSMKPSAAIVLFLILFSVPVAGLADVAGFCFSVEEGPAGQTGSMDHSMHDMAAMDHEQSAPVLDDSPCCESCVALCATSVTPTAPNVAVNLTMAAGLEVAVQPFAKRAPPAPYSGSLFRPPIAFC